MMISWRDFDRAMPRRPDQPGDEPPAAYPVACNWCGDAPEAGHTLCRPCRLDLERESKIHRGETP